MCHTLQIFYSRQKFFILSVFIELVSWELWISAYALNRIGIWVGEIANE